MESNKKKFLASQEITRILWNPEVHYRIHNSPLPFPVLEAWYSCLSKLHVFIGSKISFAFMKLQGNLSHSWKTLNFLAESSFLCDLVELSHYWGFEFDLRFLYWVLKIQGGSNMTGTDLCVNKPHCAASVRPWESEAKTSTLPPARVRTCSVLSGSC